MAHFFQRDGVFFVTYVTGPRHVALGLAFGASSEPFVLIKRKQRPAKPCDHGTLDGQQILEAVRTGLNKATSSLRSELHLTKVVYFEGDSPEYGLYGYCAYLIAKRFLENQPFESDT